MTATKVFEDGDGCCGGGHEREEGGFATVAV